MKKLTAILFLSLLSSCSLFNLHNINNQYKWKNKVFDEPIFARIIFEPIFEENYGEDAKFFYDYFEDTTKVDLLKEVFIQKLSDRNILPAIDGYESIIRIDTIYLNEETQWVDVETVEENETIYLGEAVQYNVKIKIKGRLLNLQNNQNFSIQDDYKFTSRPRPGVVLKNKITHGNDLINLQTVFTNMMNKWSVEAYKAMSD